MPLPCQKDSCGAEERQELDTVLHSGIFKKAPNLQRFLEYVAEKHFAGTPEEIKEYSIAVEALHRANSFDPQADTIVRVTAHTLRKKLEQYYAAEGSEHLIRIHLPVGSYEPQFVRRSGLAPDSPPVLLQPVLVAPEERSPTNSDGMKWPWWPYAIAALALLILLIGIAEGNRHYSVMARQGNFTPRQETAGVRTQRIRFGGKPYVDAAGQVWDASIGCKGGTVFAHPGLAIEGTDDPTLFQEGREGRFECVIPVSPGTYQLEVLFADTAGDKVSVRQVVLSINDKISDLMDIVDEASGNNIATGKVYPGIHPMRDGAIHLDFLSDGSFANAVEITPTPSDDSPPLRMVAGPRTLVDDAGNTWSPERFFSGGRRAFHAEPNVTNSRLFEWERYGHTYYHLPVVPNREYTVKLYFSESWFGVANGGTGGVGSRVFDVYCNGTTLLKDFDILKAQKNGFAVATSYHVKSTAHGTLDLSFSPSKNYPLINALEVEPE
jgi:Malectin domain